MKMWVNKRWAYQIARRVYNLARLGIKTLDRRDLVAVDTYVRDTSVGQRAAFDDQIKHQRSPLLNGTIRAAGTSALRDMMTRARMDSKYGIIRKTWYGIVAPSVVC